MKKLLRRLILIPAFISTTVIAAGEGWLAFGAGLVLAGVATGIVMTAAGLPALGAAAGLHLIGLGIVSICTSSAVNCSPNLTGSTSVPKVLVTPPPAGSALAKKIENQKRANSTPGGILQSMQYSGGSSGAVDTAEEACIQVAADMTAQYGVSYRFDHISDTGYCYVTSGSSQPFSAGHIQYGLMCPPGTELDTMDGKCKTKKEPINSPQYFDIYTDATGFHNNPASESGDADYFPPQIQANGANTITISGGSSGSVSVKTFPDGSFSIAQSKNDVPIISPDGTPQTVPVAVSQDFSPDAEPIAPPAVSVDQGSWTLATPTPEWVNPNTGQPYGTDNSPLPSFNVPAVSNAGSVPGGSVTPPADGRVMAQHRVMAQRRVLAQRRVMAQRRALAQRRVLDRDRARLVIAQRNQPS